MLCEHCYGRRKEPTAVTVDSEKIVLGNWTKEQIDSTKQI